MGAHTQAPPDPVMVGELLAATFASRRDLYNAWLPGQHGYTIPKDHIPGCPKRECDCPTSELTAQVVVDAIRRRGAVGGYHPDPQGCTHVGIVDCDRDTDGVAVALRIAKALGAVGVPAYTERSQKERAHVWIIGPTLPGLVWRFALLTACADAGYPATTTGELGTLHNIELRPEDKGGHGSAMRLPGMYNPKTGQRYEMLDPQGASMGERISDWLRTMDMAPAAALIGLAERHTPPAPPVPVKRPRELRAFDRDTSVSEVLRVVWGVPAEKALPGRGLRCPLHDDRHASLSIARDDRRVWCHSPGCAAYGMNGKGLGAAELALAGRGAA